MKKQVKKRRTWIEDCVQSLIRDREIRDEKYLKSIRRDSFKKFLHWSRMAMSRKKSFYLTEADFIALEGTACYYCGGIGSGLDRLDSSIGYTRSNVVSCCGKCNMMKYVYSKEDFISHITKIYEHQHRNS